MHRRRAEADKRPGLQGTPHRVHVPQRAAGQRPAVAGDRGESKDEDSGERGVVLSMVES